MTRTLLSQRALFFTLIVLALVNANDAVAQVTTNNSLDEIIRLYRNNSARWQTTLRDFAITLFWLLAAIEFTWAAIRLALKGAGYCWRII